MTLARLLDTTLPSLLTTAACSGLRSAPDCRPRRVHLHLSYSCAPPCGPAMLVTRCQQRHHASVTTVEGRLQKRLKGTSNNCPRLSGTPNLPTNDSALFSFRFCAVHPKDVRNCLPRQLFEVPLLHCLSKNIFIDHRMNAFHVI